MNTFALPVSGAALAIFLGRAGVALVLGGLIGAERQWRSRMAVLRPSPARRLVSFAATAAFADLIVEAKG